MDKHFNYLKDTQQTFPHTDNGNVYATEPVYDYHHWDVDTTVTVLHAPWDANYNNVIDFSDKSKRDGWFEAQKTDDTTFILTSQTTLLPSDTIRLPIPYDVIMRYNYIWVEMPKMPVPYEDDTDDRKYGFFIMSSVQIAPSTTEVRVSLDYWTSFIDTTTVNYMMLGRGHVPMALSPDVETYLDNPIDNSEYVLADDVDYGKDARVRTSYAGGWYLYDSDDLYCVIASSGRVRDANWGTSGEDMRIPAVYTPWQGGYAGCDYLTIKASQVYDFFEDIRTKIPWFVESVLGVYYVPGKLIDLSEEYHFEFAGYEAWFPATKRVIEDIIPDINKSMFGYDAKYANIVKLYTSPYAHIEVFDNAGKSQSIKIENLTGGKLQVQDSISMAGTVLTADAYIVGISGDTRNIDQHFNASINSLVSSGGYQMLDSWHIPQFAVYLDGEAHANYKRAIPNQQAATSADVAQTNAIASADTAQTNAIASADVAQTNAIASADTSQSTSNASTTTSQTNSDNNADVAKTNSIASADTSQTTGNASAATTQANSNASAATARTNGNASAKTSQSNGDASADTSHDNTARNISYNYDASTRQISLNTVLTAEQCRVQAQIVDRDNSTQQANQAWDAGLQRTLQEADAQAVAATTAVNAIAGVAGSVAGAALPGTQLGGAMDSGGMIPGTGIVQAGINAVASGINANIMLNAASTKVEASIDNSQHHIDESQPTTVANLKDQNDYATYVTTTSNSVSGQLRDEIERVNKSNNDDTQTTTKSNNAATYSTSTSNNERTYSTSTSNNARSYSTTTSNNKLTHDNTVGCAQRTYDNAIAANQRTYDTGISNAKLSHDNSVANANRTHDVSVANANRTHDVSIANANRTHDASILNNVTRATEIERHAAPISYGQYADCASVTSIPIGITASIVTEDKYAIKAAGDQMLRYGYNLHQAVDVSKWQVMRHYTYWQADDVWLCCDRAGIEDAGETIEGILRQGTTVWSTPEDIGRTSIYDN